ncbi:MAG: glycosyltransferase family 2 protein [Spirochaetia bacterium]|nr:glycosyltransferase family 2 protein [Spirochaetia bacterium]
MKIKKNRAPAGADIVIPSYNRKELTIEAVTSVLEQTFTNIQIIIVEDGSSYLQNELPNTNKIKYYQLNKNQGPSFARNYGAQKGSNQYLAFLDSDDLWHKDKLLEQIEFLENNPNINWVHTNETWFRNNTLVKQKSKHKKQGGVFIEKLMKTCLISPSSVLFRRPFWEKYGWFCESFRVAEDYELWLRLNLLFPVGYIEKPLTIKKAGTWPQLSQTLEIDKQRVLALHKFYRTYKNHPEFKNIYQSWHSEILRKIQILIKGAQKYKNKAKIIKYQNWERLFTISRTRAIFEASDGTRKNSSA